MGDLILVSIAPLIKVKNHTSNGRRNKESIRQICKIENM
jgi:hypothetical protein